MTEHEILIDWLIQEVEKRSPKGIFAGHTTRATLEYEARMFRSVLEIVESSVANYNFVISLKAMIEQCPMPLHNKFCGSNDCPACEFEAIQKDINWPFKDEE